MDTKGVIAAVSIPVHTVEQYLAGLPDDRREALTAVREVILQNLPEGFEEGIQYGMISYYVPLERFPNTYNGQPFGLAALASQKNYMSLYLISVYGDEATSDWFHDEYKKTGKRLDMGKSCVRFRKLDDLPLDLVGKVIGRMSVDEFIKVHDTRRK